MAVDAPWTPAARAGPACGKLVHKMTTREREMPETMDSELQAIVTLIATLQPLDPDARTRVINYVFEKLGIAGSHHAKGPPTRHVDSAADHEVSHHAPPTAAAASPLVTGATDIRSLREGKRPSTANEMVAIAAYYLANLAPIAERNDTIGPDDIKKYFVQANYPLPKAPPVMTLVNAKNAGYLESRGNGRYALNAVGHNLVVHKLPTSAAEDSPARRGRKKSRNTKGTRKAKSKR